MEIDNVLRSIGDYGRGQVLIFVLICSLGQLPAAWHIFAIVFLGATPEHYCNDYEESDLGEKELATGKNISSEERSSCEQHDNPFRNSTVTCENGWVYTTDVYGSTIVSEWDLVCSRAFLVELSQTVLMIGVMIGSLTAGYLADRFGRKKVFFISLFLQGIIGCFQAFSPSFTIFIILRLFMGILDQGYELPAYSMVSEWFTPRVRPYSFICLLNFWAGGILSLPILAYFIRDWRFLQLTISIPFLLFPSLYWFIPESPRWLMSVGRYEEAETILRNVARFNGKSVDLVSTTPETKAGAYVMDDKLKRESEHEKSEEKKENNLAEKGQEKSTHMNDGNEYKNDKRSNKQDTGSYIDLFRGYRMTLVTVVMATAWFVIAFSYYGLSLNAGRLAGDPYINFFLTGAVEIPSHFVATAIVVWFGRRWPTCIFLLTAGIACVGVSFVPQTSASGDDLTAVIVVLAMLGKFSIAISYAIICLYATEIFPTVVRNKGIGFVAITARVGALLAPFVIILDIHWPKVPMVLFGTVALIPSLLIMLLPEMKGRIQPETRHDLKKFFEEDRKNPSNWCKSRKKVTGKQEVLSISNRGFVADEAVQTIS